MDIVWWNQRIPIKTDYFYLKYIAKFLYGYNCKHFLLLCCNRCVSIDKRENNNYATMICIIKTASTLLKSSGKLILNCKFYSKKIINTWKNQYLYVVLPVKGNSLWRWDYLLTIIIDGLGQDRRNSIANTLELRLSCTNPSISPLSDFLCWQDNAMPQ